MAVGVTSVVTFACTESGVDLPTAASMRDFNTDHFPDTPRKPAFHVVELVPVAEADRLRAIEARHAQIVDLWLSIDGDNEELCNAQWTQLFALLDGVAAQDVVPAVGLRSEGGAS